MRKRNRRKAAISNKTILIVLFVLFVLITVVYSLLMSSVNINGNVNIVPPHAYSGWGEVEASFQNRWGNYTYAYTLKINNVSSAAIEGWTVIMNVPSDAVINAPTDQGYIIRNGKLIMTDNGSNSYIQPGGTQDLYIHFNTAQSNYEVSYLVLNGLQMNLSGQTVIPTGISITQSSISLFPDQTKDLVIRFTPYNGRRRCCLVK